MAKSVNEYYAEKMKRLLESQSQTKKVVIPLAPATKNEGAKPKGENGYAPDGRAEYDRFRENMAKKPAPVAKPYAPPKARTAEPSRKVSQTRPAPSVGEKREGQKTPAGDPSKLSFEQTAADKKLEEKQKEYALERARRGRKLRKIRDASISVLLIIAVLAVLLTVVYKLLFVISDINVEGNVVYSDEDIINSTGVLKGDNLYSFRSSVVKSRIRLRCPLVSDIELTRGAPNNITFTVKEEKAVYYSDLYGELRAVSESGRILYSVTPDRASADSLVRLYLPTVKNAIAGCTPEFADLSSDSYIYEMLSAISNASFYNDLRSIDLTDKYNITVNVSDRYLLIFGSCDSIEAKMKIASAVLTDEMFKDDIKAKIDLTDLTETSVVVDSTLVLK